MDNKIVIFSVLIFLTTLASGQTSFHAGVGQKSLEPDKSLISLALSGYAAPMEGRFTLQWKRIEVLTDVTALTGLADDLYMISNGELQLKKFTELNTTWKKIGDAENIISIAGLNEKLYAINNNGELLESVVGKFKWKKISGIDKSITSITCSDNKFYAADKTGKMWVSNSLSDNISWSELNTIRGIISLAQLNSNLYALTNEGVLFEGSLSENDIHWVKIAYRNNITIKEDIRHIVIANNGIYGISNDNVLYEGEHRSEGNLSVRAIAIKRKDKTVVILNIDLVSLTDNYIGMLKEEIYKKHKIPPAAVLMNLSHTHFAPVVQDWPTWMEHNQHPDDTYLHSTVKNGILGAVDEAINSLAPAQLYFGRGKTNIGYNRSFSDHPELYDNSVDVLKVKYADNKENYLFLASCHAVFSNAGKLHYTISANFPGVARKLIEERTGTSNSLFLQGTAGDINPKDNGEYITGEILANEVISVLNNPMTKITGEISFYLDTFNVPVEPWSKEALEDFMAENSGKPTDVGAMKNVKWAEVMLNQHKNRTMPDANPVYVNTLNIGNWKLVGFSRETTTNYSLGVKEMWPDKLISVAGYTNDVSSYLPGRMHVEKRNYEGLDSFFWYGAIPFQVSVDESILQQIRLLNR